MSSWRRVVGTLVVGALVATACTFLGLWQWHRHVARSAAVAAVEAAWDAPVEPLADLVATDGPASDAVWRRALVHGTYLTDRGATRATVLLRNRPVDGARGFHVLAAFLVDDGPWAGRVLVVDRGWLDGGEDAQTLPPVPPAPAGQVELVVRVRALEPASDRAAPAGQVQSIDLASVRAAGGWPEAAVPAYGQLVTEDGAGPQGLGPLAVPSRDLGPHLSYAFQWWVFALGALVGSVLLLRRGDDAPARRRRGAAEQEEDALLDALERAEAAAAAGQGAAPGGATDGPAPQPPARERTDSTTEDTSATGSAPGRPVR